MSSEDTRDRPWAEAADHNRRLVDEFVARPKVARSTDGEVSDLRDALARSAIESATAARSAVEGLAESVESARSDLAFFVERQNKMNRAVTDLQLRLPRSEGRIAKLEDARIPVWVTILAWAAGGASMVLLHELWEVIR